LRRAPGRRQQDEPAGATRIGAHTVPAAPPRPLETRCRMADDAISYEAAVVGTPVLSTSGAQIGTLEHVLEIPDLDLFDGIVIARPAARGSTAADKIRETPRSHTQSSLDDSQASQLPPPDGPPVYRVDALQYTGHSFHDVLGRLFRRPHWTREHD